MLVTPNGKSHPFGNVARVESLMERCSCSKTLLIAILMQHKYAQIPFKATIRLLKYNLFLFKQII